MSRVTLPGVLSVLLCLVLSPTASGTTPTTQPVVEQRTQRLTYGALPVRVQTSNGREFDVTTRAGVVYGNFVVATTQPLQVIPRALPYLRVIPPTQQTPEGWILRNRNSNTWHYIVPVGSDF